MTLPSHPVSRRAILGGVVAGAAIVPFASSSAFANPALIRNRGTLASGIQIGDVTTHEAVVWSRFDRPGRLVVELLRENGTTRRMVGPLATEASDFTAKLQLRGLRRGAEIPIRVSFEDVDGVQSETIDGSFSTADAHEKPVRFVWTGDTAGQGWGINPDIGGMPGYKTMLATRPDFLIHSGDNIYADGPIEESVPEPGGLVWRNLVTEEVSKVAETLKEFRGRYRYNQMDANIREMYRRVPVIGQWDDHEVTNNWYPSEVLNDDRYTVKNVDLLAARGRQAFYENMPFNEERLGSRGIYRTINRGEQLDIFVLDMRTFRGTDPAAALEPPTPMLGAEQVRWLLRELRRSKATWKVIASDMPIGIIIPDGADQEGVSDGVNGRIGGREHEMASLLAEIKRHDVKNVVWLTADVHYCAAHYYDPSKAVRGDFNPFYEFVAGAIHAGSFGPNKMDDTFGPQVLYSKSGDYVAQSPRFGKNQFFGQVDIDTAGVMTVRLVDATGEVLHTTVLDPTP